MYFLALLLTDAFHHFQLQRWYGVAWCLHYCYLVLLFEDRTRYDENDLSFLFSVTQEWDLSLQTPGQHGRHHVTMVAPWPIHLNFWMHHPKHLSAPKIQFSWEFSGKQAQHCWENIMIFKRSVFGDGHAAEGLECDNQKDYLAVRENICGWQLRFPCWLEAVLSKNGSHGFTTDPSVL